ncbi:MAG: sigma-54-dependent Fis family transcriptional regulator [Planctomycetes bacterium]|nr:sigma-54-dependent Fis family transcriptional regulator [Planctomycetota bacterium]
MTPTHGARILVVDDEKLIRWGICSALEEAGYLVEQAEDAGQALAAVEREAPDLVLLDYMLPDKNGLELMPELRDVCPGLPVVMVTAHASVPGAMEAVREGVSDYIGKPFEMSELMQAVERALVTSHLRDVVVWRRDQALQDFGGGEIVAHSAVMREVDRVVRRVAESGANTILLLGESGVGKGLVARALHRASASVAEDFINIACTALPQHLLESELFGHEKGSFTDAKVQKKGLLELAQGGTVFLDEIGDMEAGLQAKLLGFLEERAFRRVGGMRDIKVDARVIAATNKDLEREVAEGRFRRDLFYRLKVIPITIPTLRQRAEDLPDLVRMFLAQFNKEFRKAFVGVDEAAAAAMRRYTWPGNVRELRNALERAVLLGEGTSIVLQDLPAEVREAYDHPEPDGPAVPAAHGDGFVLPEDGVDLEQLEHEFVRQALNRTGGNRAQAARLLGMNRDQMRYRIKKFDLVEFQDDEG